MEKSMMVKIAAVVVVVIVVAVACVVIFGGGNKSNPADDIETQLQIRGNADANYTIDSRDMDIVNDVIAGKKTLKDYPLADVNGDNKVDETDKKLLQDLIDRKTGTTVYVLCQDVDGEMTTQEVKYPLRNAVTYATNIQLPALYAGGAPYIAGYFSRSYTTAAEKGLDSAVDLKGGTRSITDESWANFTNLDASLRATGGVGALLVDYSGVKELTDQRMSDLEARGIPALIYSSADAEEEITTVLTLGFLFGGDCEKLTVDYAVASWDVLDYIDKTLANKSPKTSYISFNMYVYICQNDSTYNYIGQSAGGIPYYKVNSEFADKYKGTGSVKMSGPESLSNYTDVGALINIRSIDWGMTEDEIKDMIVKTWEYDSKGVKSQECFKGFEDRLFYVDNLLPGAVKVAYTAHGLYGDLFTEKWAEGVLSDFIKMNLGPLEGQTVHAILPFLDYDDYKAAKS